MSSTTNLFPGFEPFQITVSPNISISGVRGGNGPPLLLLHGFPQTKEIWHIVAPQLTSKFTIVALDLRGYGASSKPPGSSSHIEYAKSTMARDCAAVMTALGFPVFSVCAHDRGARVAHKLCVDFPKSVKRVMFLDICPTLAMYQKTDFAFARAYFHWFLLIQAPPLPENLIMANPNIITEEFMSKRFDGFDPRAIKCYADVLQDKAAVHAMCEDYRAGASIDMEEAQEDIKAGRHIECPVRLLWGNKGIIGKFYKPIDEWKAVSATGEVDGHGVNSGHYIAEEVPDELIKEILDFFVEEPMTQV